MHQGYEKERERERKREREREREREIERESSIIEKVAHEELCMNTKMPLSLNGQTAHVIYTHHSAFQYYPIIFHP